MFFIFFFALVTTLFGRFDSITQSLLRVGPHLLSGTVVIVSFMLRHTDFTYKGCKDFDSFIQFQTCNIIPTVASSHSIPLFEGSAARLRSLFSQYFSIHAGTGKLSRMQRNEFRPFQILHFEELRSIWSYQFYQLTLEVHGNYFERPLVRVWIVIDCKNQSFHRNRSIQSSSPWTNPVGTEVSRISLWGYERQRAGALGARASSETRWWNGSGKWERLHGNSCLMESCCYKNDILGYLGYEGRDV